MFSSNTKHKQLQPPMAEACPKGQGGHDLPPPPKRPKVTKDPVSPDRAICIICNSLLTNFVEGNSNCGHVPVNQPGSFLGNLFQLPGLDAPLPFVLSYLFRKPGVQERKAAMTRKRSADPSVPTEDNILLSPLQVDPQSQSRCRLMIKRVVCAACVGPVRNAYLALANLDDRVSKEGVAFKELKTFMPSVIEVGVKEKKEEEQAQVKVKNLKSKKKTNSSEVDTDTDTANKDKEKSTVDVGVNTEKKLMKGAPNSVTAQGIKELIQSGSQRRLTTFLFGVTWALRREMGRLSRKIQEGRSELSMREITENGFLPDDGKVAKELEREFPLLKTVILSLCFPRRTFDWNKSCTTALCVFAKSFNGKINGLQATVAVTFKRLGVHKNAYQFFSELGLCASLKSLNRGTFLKNSHPEEGREDSAPAGVQEDQRVDVVDAENANSGQEGETLEDKNNDAAPSSPIAVPISNSSVVALAINKCENLPRRQLWPVKNKPLKTLLEEIKSFGGKATTMEEHVLRVELQKQENEMAKKARIPRKDVNLEERRRRIKASGIVAKSKALLVNRGRCSSSPKVKTGQVKKKTKSKELNTEENPQATMKIVRKMTTAVKKSPFAPTRKQKKKSGANVGDGE